MVIQYPILIERGEDGEAWGIIVPDLPGCFSAADEEQDILSNARDAVLLHLESLDSYPEPSPIDVYSDQVAREGFLLGLVDVDLALIEGVAKRINVTIPAGALVRIDAAAKQRGKTRSAFLTESALRSI